MTYIRPSPLWMSEPQVSPLPPPAFRRVSHAACHVDAMGDALHVDDIGVALVHHTGTQPCAVAWFVPQTSHVGDVAAATWLDGERTAGISAQCHDRVLCHNGRAIRQWPITAAHPKLLSRGRIIRRYTPSLRDDQLVPALGAVDDGCRPRTRAA